MLDKKELKRLAGDVTYKRGQELYRMNEIEEFTVSSDEGSRKDYILAVVHGSGRKRYQVNLTYSYEEEELVDYDCECPAYNHYTGLCKHCVAAALEYIDRLEIRMAIQQYMNVLSQNIKKGRPAVRTASGYAPASNREPGTTPSMKALLGNRILQRSLPVTQREICGKVSLEPSLYVQNGDWKLDFHIGVSRKYVLKDIFTFTRLLEAHQAYAYGQKLNFVHDISAFSEDSVPIVNFLRSWVRNNQERYVQNVYYYYGYGERFPKLRQIKLSAAELESFLELMEDREFTAYVGNQNETIWKMCPEKLRQKVVIRGKAQGAEVSINFVPGVFTGTALFYFQEGRVYRVDRQEIEPVMDFMKCLNDLPGRKAYIEKIDIPAFCRELLPSLEKHFDCVYENFVKEKYGIEEVCFEIYLDAPQRDFITCRLKAVYGNKKYDVYGKQGGEIYRDLVKEMETGSKVGGYFNAYDEDNACMALAEDEDMLYELLTRGIAEFQGLGEVYLSDALKRIRINPAPRAALGISLSGDLLELTMTSEDVSMEQLQEILSRYDRKKKYYRLKTGEFIDMNGESIGALLELKGGLCLTDAQIREGKALLPKYRALYVDVESREWEALPIKKNGGFKALVRNMKTVEDNDFEVPQSLEKILREYQKKGFLWLKTLKHNGFGGILADDMGLGKTLQVIAFFLSEMEMEKGARGPSLVVCPASLVYNWKSEFDRFAPALCVKTVTGTGAERKALLSSVGEGEILITSYDLLRRDIREYENMTFACQVVDEAHYIKNHNTQAAKAVKEIRAGFRLALTGTPIENRLSELWSIFDFLMPGFLYEYQRFKNEFEFPIVHGGEEAAARRLQKMIRPFILRRLKREVLKDLPDKLEENLYVCLEGEQQALYDAHVKRLLLMLDKHSDEEFSRNKIQVLAELTKLRQLCCDPSLLYENYQGESAKAQLCVDLIKNAVGGGHKLLLFSQFTSMLSHLCSLLKKEGISYYVLTGATDKEKRRDLVEAFQQDETSVFCISLKAGGTGLNLTAADIVIHYDPWWNVAVQNQAADRAHRLGQVNVVNVYRLIAKDTIEEKILKLQEKKRGLSEQLLGNEGLDATDFTRDELIALLGKEAQAGMV